MNAIELHDVCKSYKDFSLEHLHLQLAEGCIMGLIGENGAGKSTIIKLMLDMIRRDSGSITLLGHENPGNLPQIREDLGIVLDTVGLPACLTAKQVEHVMRHIYKNWEPSVFMDYLRRFDIPERKKFKELSAGMKMKMGIAVALSHRAKLLILDEATNGLDPVVRDEVLDILSEFTREEGHSILISSHIVSDLEKICDYIAFLHKGKLLLCEEKDLLKANYGVVHCTMEDFRKIPSKAIISKKISPYGIEAIAERSAIPNGMRCSSVDIEQLFICMAKEEQ